MCISTMCNLKLKNIDGTRIENIVKSLVMVHCQICQWEETCVISVNAHLRCDMD